MSGSSVTCRRSGRRAAILFGLLLAAPVDLSASAAERDMAYVPAGEFLMGTARGAGGYTDEQPQRNVFLSAFWIDVHEVTNRRYLQFVESSGHRAPAHDNPAITLWEDGSPLSGSEDHPVVNVSWHDADAYCRWIGKRLPTEAEWEKAARGVAGLRYPWGDSWDDGPANSASSWAGRPVEFQDPAGWRAFWLDGEGARAARDKGLKGEVLTLPVGGFQSGASPYGLLDMAGNVSEWVADYFNPYYYVNSPLSNPPGPDPTILKSIRGGSWLKPTSSLRTSDRDYGDPDARMSGVGFRCATDDR